MDEKKNKSKYVNDFRFIAVMIFTMILLVALSGVGGFFMGKAVSQSKIEKVLVETGDTAEHKVTYYFKE